MTPLELRILRSNRKIQILDHIHKLHMELFAIESDEILAEHKALSEFISMDSMKEFELEDPPKKKARKHKKPSSPKFKGIERKLFDGTKFESISYD